MDAGQFDRRIMLQQPQEADDSYATVTGEYLDIAEVWAKLIPISGAERIAAGQTSAFRKLRFKIRRDSLWTALNESWQIQFEDKPYNIDAVQSEGRGFYLLDVSGRGDVSA
jgi:SPP1 family predicted phage head-tail adaptor